MKGNLLRLGGMHMTPATLRIIIGVVLIVHGVGHWMGLLPASGLFSSETWHARSWLFTDLLGETGARILCALIFGLTLIGSIAAGLAVFNWVVPHDWWRPLAIISAIISTQALVFYWNGYAMIFNKVGGIIVNLAIFIGLIIMRWPSEADIGY